MKCLVPRLPAALLIATLPVFGQLPEMYKRVARVTWVVDDLDRVTAG